tara:strand:+ start:1168 stop:1368 length:201 start_codon:yes stop_codon:yes gene_type:complete
MKTKTITLSVVKDKRYIHEAIRNGALEQNKKASSLANELLEIGLENKYPDLLHFHKRSLVGANEES